MEKTKKVFGALALCASLSAGSDNPALVLHDYKDTIIYQDFSKINFNALSTRELPISAEIQKNLRKPKIENIILLEELILAEAAKLGIDLEKMKVLPKKNAIMLAIDVAKSSLTYALVDDDKEFLDKYGTNLPIEQYMKIGRGDCDKYADVAIAAFYYIKEKNKALRNVHITSNSGLVGGGMHAWNVLIFLERDKIIITHVDPTFYDNPQGRLEAERGQHIPEDDEEIAAQFFAVAGDYQTSYNLYEKILLKAAEDEKKTTEILDKMAYYVFTRKKIYQEK